MTHLHIVEPYHSAAMYRMSAPLIEALPKIYKVTTGAEPDLSADLNYHVPFHTLVNLEKGTGKHAMLYTHCNPGAESDLMDACERADLIVCMSFAGRHELVERGVDPARLWVIYASGGGIPMRRRNIGVIGFEQPNGRKRSHLLIDLAWKLQKSAVHFVIVGGGWEDTVSKMQAAGASAEIIGPIEQDQMVNMYAALDMLLVTGYVEGGPLPVLEALSAGVPVLAPRMGYAADLLPEDCFYDDIPDLVEKLNNFVAPYTERMQLSNMYTWQGYAEEHALIFGRLLDEEVELDPQAGAGRYAQLLDIIDEYKPSTIVEIGTWSGARGVQMIQQAAKYRPVQYVTYQGYDLFESMTAEQFKREFSKWGYPQKAVDTRLRASGACTRTIAGETKDTLPVHALYFPNTLYFIDGGHSEKTIASDWSHISVACAMRGKIVVFDDYYHANKPEGMGCNTLIDSLDRNIYNVEHLPVRTTTADGLEIGMVKVTYAGIPVHGPESTRDVNSALNEGVADPTLPPLWRDDVAKAPSVLR